MPDLDKRKTDVSKLGSASVVLRVPFKWLMLVFHTLPIIGISLENLSHNFRWKVMHETRQLQASKMHV